MEPKTGYHSPIISALIESNKTDIIELAKSKSASNEIPFQILNSNDKIELTQQNKAFKCLKELHKQNRNITLPSQIRYQICLDVLKTLYKLYGWSGSNTKLNNVNTLSYFAMLMCKWVNNESLSQIISESIEYYHVQHRKISLNHKLIDFDRQNKIHVNELIGNIIEDIEEILRFQLEKYFNHYHMIVKNILGEENAGENWAMLLEYGTPNREIIALQNMGLSRYSAQKIFKECRGAFISENGQLKKVDKSKILSKLQKGSIELYRSTKIAIKGLLCNTRDGSTTVFLFVRCSVQHSIVRYKRFKMTTPPSGDGGHRNGAVKNRSQVFNPQTEQWVKRIKRPGVSWMSNKVVHLLRA